jgi:hypothetical protein
VNILMLYKDFKVKFFHQVFALGIDSGDRTSYLISAY